MASPVIIVITLSPSAKLFTTDGQQLDRIGTQELVRNEFAPQLPGLFSDNRKGYGLEEQTRTKHIQVRSREFSEDDINVPVMQVDVNLSQVHGEITRGGIRDLICDDINTSIVAAGLQVPDDFVALIHWGPTSGAGRIGDQPFMW